MSRWGKRRQPSGFTIVELLIVIVVIGILAAIVVVAFTGVQNRAHDAAVRQDLKNAYQKLAAYEVTSGSLPINTRVVFQSDPIKASKGSYDVSPETYFNFIYCPPYPYGKSSNFAMIGKSKSGKLLVYSTAKGAYEYTGTYGLKDDYVEICQEIVDTAHTWTGSYTDPFLCVSSPGFNYGYTSRWLVWAGGPSDPPGIGAPTC